MSNPLAANSSATIIEVRDEFTIMIRQKAKATVPSTVFIIFRSFMLIFMKAKQHMA
jgi:hypothetical protein